MKTAWTAFVEWKRARDDTKDAFQRFVKALENVAKHESEIADLLQRHGPITHDNHVYFICQGRVACEPCTDSFSVNLEEPK